MKIYNIQRTTSDWLGYGIGGGGCTYTDTNDTMIILHINRLKKTFSITKYSYPTPVNIYWKRPSNFILITAVKKKNKLAQAAHLVYISK
jgi:hypothetical protein